MTQAIKRTLVLPILDQEVAVDVDFRVIEIVERVYDLSADAVIVLLSDQRRIQRHKLADVVMGWLAFRDLGAKRREIREDILSAPAERLAVYSSAVYAALLFTLNYFDKKDPKENAKKFDELLASDEWPKYKVGGEAAADQGKKKSHSRANATK